MTETSEAPFRGPRAVAAAARGRWLGHLWPLGAKDARIGLALLTALAFVALATLARMGIGLIANNTAIFITYHPAILLATLIAGFWSGVIALVLGALAGWWFFIVPRYAFNPLTGDQEVTLALYVAVAALLIVIAHSHRQLSHRAERQAYEARLAELQSELIHMSRLTAMGEMASALAHELNQPLSAIANYVSGSRRLLADGAERDPAPLRYALDQAAEQSLRAGRIIGRLRDFVAHRETEKRPESLHQVVQEAVVLALVGTRELGVRLRYAFDRSRDRVLIDKVQIQQVVLNLVRNAVEAMQSAQRRELVVSSAAGDADLLTVSIADTGPGIAPEIADHLFQPFSTTKSNGMGIGLSISRTIIEAHGGRIWAEPNPGGGAVFRFTLPVLSEAPEAASAASGE